MNSWRFFLRCVGVSCIATVGSLVIAQQPGSSTNELTDEQKTAALCEELKRIPEIGLTEGLVHELEAFIVGERDAQKSFQAAATVEPSSSRSAAKQARGFQTRSDRDKPAASATGEPRPIHPQLRAWETLGLTARTGSRAGEESQLKKPAVKALQVLSSELRRGGMVALIDQKGEWQKPGDKVSRFRRRNDPFTGEEERGPALMKAVVNAAEDQPARAVPALMQMLQTEDVKGRMLLLETLGHFNHPEVAAALAKRALFDTSPQVRKRAIELLAQRRPEQYRAVLLSGFRHVWAPASHHAAEALIAVKDREAIPGLKKLLDEPEPSAPSGGDGKLVVRELVRVNHLKNCLLCHAPALSPQDPVVGRVPDPAKKLPSGVEYYESQKPSPTDILVRADISYLRQDFSVMLPVKDAWPWPEMQRFDFLVRTRPATAEELAAMKTSGKRSPRREAILRALDGLK